LGDEWQTFVSPYLWKACKLESQAQKLGQSSHYPVIEKSIKEIGTQPLIAAFFGITPTYVAFSLLLFMLFVIVSSTSLPSFFLSFIFAFLSFLSYFFNGILFTGQNINTTHRTNTYTILTFTLFSSFICCQAFLVISCTI